MSDITAVILSKSPVRRSVAGVKTLVHASIFKNAAGLLAARKAAIKRVQTEWFFFLDDDDALPDGYAELLARCVDTDAALSYTRERVFDEVAGTEYVSGNGPWTRERHVMAPQLIHHLAVCRTRAAIAACAATPDGMYAFENLVYFRMACDGGANFIDEVGYVWHRGAHGLSRHPTLIIGQAKSACVAAGVEP